MILSNVCRVAGVLVVAAAAANVNRAADSSSTRTPPAKAGASAVPASRPGSAASKSGSARGPLPDPALLDGSTQAAEKKSEHGMIGDFELPGDENARSGKVGGPQNQNPAQGGGAQSANQAMSLPQGGGGGQQSQQQGQQSPQGSAQSGAQSGAQAAGGAQAGGQNAAGNPISGAGDPGAQPQGIQVAELGGDAAGQPQAGGPGEKPQQVAIGDSAMKIEQAAPQAGVVGAQQPAGQTQQHEKGTGSGGKGTGGAGSGNRVEKGRVIPAGL